MALPKGFSDWLVSLVAASAQAGDQVPIVQGGATKRVPAGQAGGLATLDASGKLAQPRRVLGVHLGTVSANVTTTAVYANAPVIGVVDMPVRSHGHYVIAMGAALVRADDTDNTYVRGQWVYSDDGGNTWNAISYTPLQTGVAAGQHVAYPLGAAKLGIAAGTAYKIGIRIGNGISAGPSITIIKSTHTSILYLEVDY